MSSPFVEAEEVRRRITTDHAVLRSLSRALVTIAEAATIDDRERPFVRDLLAQFCTELELHLQYEEMALVPILQCADAWGAVRVEELVREHADQRAVAAALLEEAPTCHDIRELGAAITQFIERIERDIDEEERDLLTADALGERVIVIDQTTG